MITFFPNSEAIRHICKRVAAHLESREPSSYTKEVTRAMLIFSSTRVSLPWADPIPNPSLKADTINQKILERDLDTVGKVPSLATFT